MTLSQGDRTKPGDENKLFLAVCFGGHFSALGYEGPEEPSLEQLGAAVELWRHLKKAFGFTNRQVYGHCDFGKPACPGTTLQTLIGAINRDKDWTDPPKVELDMIRGRQSALAQLGFYNGKIDGVWGALSRAALARCQRSAGLPADGVWGKRTTAGVLEALARLKER